MRESPSDPPLCRVFLLGAFAIEWLTPALDAEIWQSRRSALALFKLLLCAPIRQAGCAVLAGILWPETDEDKVLTSVRSAVQTLRKVLRVHNGERLLENALGDEALKLAGQEQLWLDIDAFEALVEAGYQEAEARQALSLLQQARHLLRGELLVTDQGQEWLGLLPFAQGSAQHQRVLTLLSLGYQLPCCVLRDQMNYPQAHIAYQRVFDAAKKVSEAYAKLHQDRACWQHLAAAEKSILVDQERLPEKNIGLIRCNTVSIVAQKGVDAVLLQDYDQAIHLISSSLVTYDPRLMRGRARQVAQQAEAYYGLGVLDACPHSGAALSARMGAAHHL